MRELKSKVNFWVWLVMIFMLIPTFFMYQFQRNGLDPVQKVKAAPQEIPVKFDRKSESYDAIPERPVVLTEIPVYKDQNLTKKVGTLSAQTQLKIKALLNNNKVFELSNQTYVAANKSQIGSDFLLSKTSEQMLVYSSKKIKVLYNPFTTFDNQVYTELTGSQSLQVTAKAQTNWGTYYQINFNGGQTGWINSNDVSLENPKMQQLQKLLNQKYNKSNYSIYVKELDSKFTVGVNQNQKMYSASLSKLPILYWTQKRLNDGQANLNDELSYLPIINTFTGSFDPAGTGSLPEIADGKSYRLLDVINRTAKNSDNVGSNLLAYYETGQFSPEFQKAITQIAGAKWNPSERDASAQMVGQVLSALYQEGGACFNALFGTQFDNIKIEAGLPKNIRVAHKIGDADSYNHDAAIVFAAHPYILVIETNGAKNEQISQISRDVYGVLQ